MRGRPPRGTHDRPGEVEPLAGPGHADVREPALLLELGLVAERAHVREDAVLHAGEEHHRELQALRGVQGHQRDHPGLLLVGLVGDLVGVGDQGHPLQEVGEAGGDRAGVDVGGVRGRAGDGVVGELAGHGDELGEVLDPGLVLRVVGGLELGEVAGALQHRLQHHVGPLPRVDHRLQLLDHADEALDRLERAGRDARRLVGPAQRLPEDRPLPLGVRRHAGLGAVADAPLGDVEHPAERDLVGRVDQHPEVGERVADLAALVEAHPADHLVGLAGADEHLLEHPGLGVGPVEHRHVAGPGDALVGELVDLLGDEPGLVALVVADVPDDLGAVAGLAPEPLGLAALVVADHRVGGVEDRLGGAVVLLEQDRGGVREVLLEVHDVADVGAAERVDRLVRVTDHHQLGGLDPLAAGAGLLHLVGAELVDEGVLRVVGVLVLVDEHVAEAAAVDLAHLRERLEQVHRGHDQVVEVERVGVAQPPLVELVGGGVRLLDVVAGVLLGLVGVAELVLLVGDPVEDRPRLVALRVEVEVLADQRHQPLGVGGVVDREARLEPELVDLLAEDPHAGGVERRDPHDPGALADQVLDPLLHLGGGLVGEGDRQDRAGMGLALLDQPGDPAGQHPGLAGAGAGHDQQRRTGVHDRRTLWLVEPVEQGLGGRRTAGGDGLEAGDRERAHRRLNPTCPHRPSADRGPPGPTTRAAAWSGPRAAPAARRRRERSGRAARAGCRRARGAGGTSRPGR